MKLQYPGTSNEAYNLHTVSSSKLHAEKKELKSKYVSFKEICPFSAPTIEFSDKV